MGEKNPIGGGHGKHSRLRKAGLIKELEGNRAKVAADKVNPDPQGIGEPTVPEGLSDEALRLWHDVVGSLPKGLLSRADNALLQAFAMEWATYRAADLDIQKRGLLVRTKYGRIRNPSLITRNVAGRALAAFAAQLGLSPVARSRITTPFSGGSDPLALLLGDDGDPDGAWSTAPKTRQ